MYFFKCNTAFEQNVKANFVFSYFFLKNYSSLGWYHYKKYKICVTKELLKRSSHSRRFRKYNCSQKQPLRCIFQYCYSKLVVNFLKKYMWWSAILSKFLSKTFLDLTTGAVALYFVISFSRKDYSYGLKKLGKFLIETSEIIRQVASPSL